MTAQAQDPLRKLAEQIALDVYGAPPGETEKLNAETDGAFNRDVDHWEARLRSALGESGSDQARIATLEQERDRLDGELDDEVDEKEHWLSQVNKLADAIGVEEEWDTENDRSEIALERIAELRADRDRLVAELAESQEREASSDECIKLLLPLVEALNPLYWYFEDEDCDVSLEEAAQTAYQAQLKVRSFIRDGIDAAYEEHLMRGALDGAGRAALAHPSPAAQAIGRVLEAVGRTAGHFKYLRGDRWSFIKLSQDESSVADVRELLAAHDAFQSIRSGQREGQPPGEEG